jgi:glycosyltransferase involved in cell wall biosynthesis
MKILYHLPILPPERPACEAISQEISALRSRFGGDVIYLNPNRHSPIYVPRLLFGFHKLRQLRILEESVDIHHLYNPDPFPFPILRVLRKPVVYSLTGGVEEKKVNTQFFGSLAAVTVTDQKSFYHLGRQGVSNVFLVPPGIDTSRFTYTCQPLRSEVRLMVGSAPWTRAQFKTKGVNALLEVACQMPRLHLVFLWRGVLTEEMERRVRRMGLEDRVEVLDRVVDVNEILAEVHASVTLAMEPDIVKAYPHSLLESLAAGKPVLVSRAIPMADYVEEKGCGVVVEKVRPNDVIVAVETLIANYYSLQRTTHHLDKRTISRQNMILSFEMVYANASVQSVSGS